jgi:hypothetical protein
LGADEVVGKHEFITWALALNADGSVRQIEILTIARPTATRFATRSDASSSSARPAARR